MINRLAIGICDDKKKSIDDTKKLCEEVSKELGIEFIFYIFTSGEEVLKYGENIDILLLDIEMNGMNGIETMHILEDMNTIKNIVFVSGYSDYIHESFGIKTKGFVCKPIEYSRLKNEIEKTIMYMKKDFNKQFVEVDVGRKHILIDAENIMYIQGEGRYVRMVTNTESHLAIENIKVWEQKLCSSSIHRVHKSYMVNFKFVANIVGTELVLKDNVRLPIGRKYYKLVKEQYREYLFERMRLNGR